LDLVLQHYPSKSTIAFPAPFAASQSDELPEAVTGWGDGERSVMSARLRVDDDVLNQVSALPTANYEANWDMAVYPPESNEWIACVVPHENMVMVGDDCLAGALGDAGLNVSSEPPEWW